MYIEVCPSHDELWPLIVEKGITAQKRKPIVAATAELLKVVRVWGMPVNFD